MSGGASRCLAGVALGTRSIAGIDEFTAPDRVALFCLGELERGVLLEGEFGVGFRNGFTCRLGEFVPLSPEEVEDLDLRERGRETRRAVESRSVDLEEDDEENDAETAAEDEAADSAPAEEGDEADE